MKYLKPFFNKAKPILDLISRESSRKNKYAQKTAKELDDFYSYAEALYLENIQLRLRLKESQQIVNLQFADMREHELLKERDTLRSWYAKHEGKEEFRKIIKELAYLNVESLKFIQDGSK